MNNQLLLIIIIIIVIFFIYNSTTKSVKQQFSSMSDTFIPHIDTAATMGAAIFNNDDYVDEIFGINSNDSYVLLAQNKQIDAGHGDQLLGDTTHLGVDELDGRNAFHWYKPVLVGFGELGRNDAFWWVLDPGNDATTLNNDNYVDKIVETNSNNSFALLAKNKQIADGVLGDGATVTIAGAGTGAGTGANFLSFHASDTVAGAGMGADFRGLGGAGKDTDANFRVFGASDTVAAAVGTGSLWWL